MEDLGSLYYPIKWVVGQGGITKNVGDGRCKTGKMCDPTGHYFALGWPCGWPGDCGGHRDVVRGEVWVRSVVGDTYIWAAQKKFGGRNGCVNPVQACKGDWCRLVAAAAPPGEILLVKFCEVVGVVGEVR